MSLEIDNAQREIAALNQQRRAASTAALKPQTGSEGHLGLALLTGTRVLDLVTGLEGVIVDATVEHVIISGA